MTLKEYKKLETQLRKELKEHEKRNQEILLEKCPFKVGDVVSVNCYDSWEKLGTLQGVTITKIKPNRGTLLITGRPKRLGSAMYNIKELKGI